MFVILCTTTLNQKPNFEHSLFLHFYDPDQTPWGQNAQLINLKIKHTSIFYVHSIEGTTQCSLCVVEWCVCVCVLCVVISFSIHKITT